MPARIMEKYTPFIPSDKDYCTRAGKIPGDNVIPIGEDICWAYKFVDELPDLGVYPHKICIPTVKIGQFQPGEVLIARKQGDAVRWTRLPLPTKGVGIPTEFTCVYSADRTEVNLRWKDPADIGPYVWKKTRVLRKINSYPANENDGVIVAESTVRDRYYNVNNELVDTLPTNMSQTRWHYKIFVYSSDGVVTTDNTCQLEPVELVWGDDLHAHIQNGRAKNIFHIGDEITVTGAGRSYTFVVVGFDIAASVDAERRRTVMLVSKTPIATNLQFDKPHPEYVPFEGKTAVKGTVVYYQKVGSTYKVISIPTDTLVPSAAFPSVYVKEKDINATVYGVNLWATSSSRSWLNETWLNNLKTSDADFGGMVVTVQSETLDGTESKVHLPTLEQMDSLGIAMTGWSCIPVMGTDYSVYYRDSYGNTIGEYARATKSSHVIINIG